ncbi:MAG: hypothetical protein ACRDTG_13545 [Pseudonocardiaceae bacterium]
MATLYQWTPVTALAAPDISVHSEVTAGWHRRGQLHVPGVGD